MNEPGEVISTTGAPVYRHTPPPVDPPGTYIRITVKPKGSEHVVMTYPLISLPWGQEMYVADSATLVSVEVFAR